MVHVNTGFEIGHQRATEKKGRLRGSFGATFCCGFFCISATLIALLSIAAFPVSCKFQNSSKLKMLF
jgi:hypothetical protein